jgi:hypothetical protein
MRKLKLKGDTGMDHKRNIGSAETLFFAVRVRLRRIKHVIKRESCTKEHGIRYQKVNSSAHLKTKERSACRAIIYVSE